MTALSIPTASTAKPFARSPSWLASAGLVVLWTLLCGFGAERPAAAGSASLAMADATVASGMGTAALYGNPAGMSQAQQGVIEGGFARSGPKGGGGFYGTYVDSTSSWGLAAGVGWEQRTAWASGDGQPRFGQDVRAGLSVGGQSDAGKLLFGVSGRWLDVTSQATGSKRSVTGWTGDVGATVGLQHIRIGAVLRNALQIDDVEAPRRLATGIALVGERGVLEVDGSWGLLGDKAPAAAGDGPSYRVGGALQFAEEGLQLRGGYVYDNIIPASPQRHWISGGLSWRTTQASIDTGVSVDVANGYPVQFSASLTWLVPYDWASAAH